MPLIELFLPKSIITWGQDQDGFQLPITVGMYMEFKRISDGVVLVKQFDVAGGYHGANNHTADFQFQFEAGEYELTIAAVHNTRLPVQLFYKRHDDSDTNSSSTSLRYVELLAGQKAKFGCTISAYNVGNTQWFKVNTLAWFENRSTHQWMQRNPTPPPYPASSSSGQLLEKQYYAQDVCPIVATVDSLHFQNPLVPVLPQDNNGITTSRFTLPNTPTIQILNPNNNGGVAQYVSNPFFQNINNQPVVPTVLSPLSQSLGTPISGTVSDNTVTVVVFRNGIEITTITPQATQFMSGSWSYTPTTSEVYKFKARKGGIDSVFSAAINVTNSCNLVNNQMIATWNVNGNSFMAKTFDAGITFDLIKVVSTNPLKFEKRGKNMLQRSDMTSLGTWKLADLYNCFRGIDTGTGGLEYDTTFQTPAGFKKVGDIFEQTITIKPSAPVLASATGTVGVMLTGVCDQAGTVVVFRDNIQVSTVLTSGVTNLYGYNPIQSGSYTFKNTNDNGTSNPSIVVIVKVITGITTRKFRAKAVEYADISPENIESGTSTTTAAAVSVWKDGLIIETDIIIVANLKGFIRDKTNHARVFGRAIQ